MLKNRGFTLVEMLVALALFSLLLAVVAPNLLAAQQARQQSADLRLFESKLKSMGLRASLSNSPLDMASYLSVYVPEQASLTVVPSGAYFDAQGFCNATSVALYKQEHLLRRWDLAAPNCTGSL